MKEKRTQQQINQEFVTRMGNPKLKKEIEAIGAQHVRHVLSDPDKPIRDALRESLREVLRKD